MAAEPVLLSLSPSFAVEILPKGLVVNRLLVEVDGKTHDLVVGPNDPNLHGVRPHKYQNTIIGRYTNRLPTGSLPIERDGYQAIVNPVSNEHPKVSLHGGVEGFDTKDWKKIGTSEATLFSEKEKKDIASLPDSVIFTHISKDGDQGFPGDLLVEVLFAVSSGNPQTQLLAKTIGVGSLYIVYRARLLEGSKSRITPINLTQHWGFNLEASLTEKGQPTPDILNHKLFMKSDKIVELDELALATGKFQSVSGLFLNPNGARIGDNFPAGGYDEFYVFSPPTSPVEAVRVPFSRLQSLDLFEQVLAAPATTDPLVRISSERSGITLAFDSNQPGVQFYSAKFFDGKGTRKQTHGWSGEDGDGYGIHTFAFLEFHEPLAAWLHPEIAVTGDTLLTANELYNNFVRVDVLITPSTA